MAFRVGVRFRNFVSIEEIGEFSAVAATTPTLRIAQLVAAAKCHHAGFFIGPSVVRGYGG